MIYNLRRGVHRLIVDMTNLLGLCPVARHITSAPLYRADECIKDRQKEIGTFGG